MCQRLTDWEKAKDFHGHVCVGLALGYRVAKAGLEILEAERAPDEEMVVIAETDNCGIDAVQVVTGCTMGKGNLVFRDHGKNAYTLGYRSTGEAVRIVVKPRDRSLPEEYAILEEWVRKGEATLEDKEQMHRIRMEKIEEVLNAPREDLLDIQKIKLDFPGKARLFGSVTCTRCGEVMMEPRARVRDGQIVCIACSDPYSSRLNA